MNKRRLTQDDLPYLGAVRRGERRCKWCGKEVKPPKQCWCSQACVDEYRLRSDPGFARRKVFERDQGVCACCGMDAWLLKWELQRIDGANLDNLRLEFGTIYSVEARAHQVLLRGRYGFPLFRTLWEADHIVPVSEGGGACGLENLRTLCLRCHRQHTAALARRRAEARTMPARRLPQLFQAPPDAPRPFVVGWGPAAP